jgi:arylsulfatase A-like enzyme
MKRQAGTNKPFFVYLPYTATDFPTIPHPDFVGKSGNGPWADLLMQIDSYTGELLDMIDELGISDDTIFIFTADNGPEAFDFEATNLTVETAIHGSPGPGRGTLFTGFEGALRVPSQFAGQVKLNQEDRVTKSSTPWTCFRPWLRLPAAQCQTFALSTGGICPISF